jgi:acetolactate synthase I/II/III large subunit
LPPPGRLHPDPRTVDRLAEALAHAQRPLILGGRGAVLSDAEPALVTLADRVGALLATSVCGHALFSKNPWSVGISGGFSSPVTDDLIAERFHSRIRREFHAMDHQEGQSNRSRRRGRAGRY